MTLRADHIAGGALVLIGIAIVAMSGDLPFGRLSMPGSGFLPRIVAIMLIVLGGALLLRARESEPLSAISWSDGKHAGLVIAITAIAIALYTQLGFVLSMLLLIGALLVIVERRTWWRAALYCAATVLVAYAAFGMLLKTPMPQGPFGF